MPLLKYGGHDSTIDNAIKKSAVIRLLSALGVPVRRTDRSHVGYLWVVPVSKSEATILLEREEPGRNYESLGFGVSFSVIFNRKVNAGAQVEQYVDMRLGRWAFKANIVSCTCGGKYPDCLWSKVHKSQETAR